MYYCMVCSNEVKPEAIEVLGNAACSNECRDILLMDLQLEEKQTEELFTQSFFDDVNNMINDCPF